MSDQAGTKVCPHCKKEVNKDASRCPHCQGKIYVWTLGRKILADALGFIVLMIIIGSSGDSNTSTSVATKSERSNVEVCVETQHILKDFLKSPSTADFPTCNTFSIEKLAEDQYKVSSYVDSQNGFGAMIRSNWSITYHYTDGGTRTQLDLVMIDGKVMYGQK